MARHPALARSPLLAGLLEDELDALSDRMHPRRFDAGEELCRAGEDSDCIWLITGGLVHWFVPTTEGAGDLQLRLRKGEVIGAQDAISGEPRSATVVASISTSTLELATEDLVDLARRFPQILVNLIRTQRERLFRVNARSAETERGEEIALVAGPSLLGTVGPLVSAARAASPRPIIFLDRKLSFAGALTAADDLVAQHGTVLIPAELEPETLDVLLDEVDRVVALVGTAAEAQRLGELSAAAQDQRLEVVLVGDEAAAVGRSWSSGLGDRARARLSPCNPSSRSPMPISPGSRATSPVRSSASRSGPEERRVTPTSACCRSSRRPVTSSTMRAGAASAASSQRTWRSATAPTRSTSASARRSIRTPSRHCSRPRSAAARPASRCSPACSRKRQRADPSPTR